MGYGWRAAVVASAAAAGGLLLATAGGAGTPAATAVTTPEVPNLWRWELASLPAPAVNTTVKLVVRTRTEPYEGGPKFAPRSTPLRDDEGRDRVVAVDTHTWDRWGFGASGTRAVDGSVSAQLHDLRALGVPPGPAPYRMTAAARFGNVVMRGTAVLAGVTTTDVVRHPADAWDGGELPLVTVVSVEPDTMYTHTVLLVASPFNEE